MFRGHSRGGIFKQDKGAAHRTDHIARQRRAMTVLGVFCEVLRDIADRNRNSHMPKTAFLSLKVGYGSHFSVTHLGAERKNFILQR